MRADVHARARARVQPWRARTGFFFLEKKKTFDSATHREELARSTAARGLADNLIAPMSQATRLCAEGPQNIGEID
jgi:hypothetical protein